MSTILHFPRAPRSLVAAPGEADTRAARDVLHECWLLAGGKAREPVSERDRLVRMAALTIRRIGDIDSGGDAA